MIETTETPNQTLDLKFKIVIVGDSGVGKTCFLISFVKESYHAEYKATIGIDFATKLIEIDEKLVRLQIWDTAGQEKYRTLTSNYFKGVDAVIMIYDVTRISTFENISYWSKVVKEKTSEGTIVALVANMIDKSNRQVSFFQGREFASQNHYLFFETSSKHKLNNIMIFKTLTQKILLKQCFLNFKIDYESRTNSEKISGFPLKNSEARDSSFENWFCCL